MKGMMKAAVMSGVGNMTFEQRPIPTPKPDEVLVKIEYCGVCGSDLHYFFHGGVGDNVVKGPVVLGHEAGGLVVEVGSEVSHLKAGDRVALEPGKTCGKCEFCQKGLYNLCRSVVFFATPPVDGTFREYVAHEAKLCFKLPENVSTMEGALIEPLAVGFHAAMEGGAQFGQTAVVMGAGCIGLCSLLALKARGVTQVYVVDIMQTRLERAMALGATGVINSANEDALEAILRVTQGKGADLLIETAGAEATAQLCIRAARAAGTVVWVGHSPTGMFNIPMSAAMNKELTFKTIFRYRHIYPLAIRAVADGVLPLDKLASHTFAFEDIQNAMEQSQSNKAEVVKAVIAFS